VNRVVPNDPANSFLMAKLNGTQDCGGSMPAAAPLLSPEQRAIVEDWILDGAQQN
jgi:hypothetical protein